VFRYYRHNFLTRYSVEVEEPFEFWTGLRDDGDKHYYGAMHDEQWEPLSSFFIPAKSTGRLANESCVDNEENANDNECSRQASTLTNADRPLVFKVVLGMPSQPAEKRTATLSRLDVLKQMFDAFINRLLAYSFQTHIGLITFGSTASVSQDITNAVENFRHQLNSMTAKGHTAIWDSK
jgi:hypothetical protein